jgi:hypothetical protein
MIATADSSRAEARIGMKKEGLSGTTEVVPYRMGVHIRQFVYGSLCRVEIRKARAPGDRGPLATRPGTKN